MALPLIIQAAIARADVVVHIDPAHQLKPFYRRAIYTTFGPVTDPVGWRCRLHLEIITISFMQQTWEQFWPEYTILEDLFAAAKAVLDGRLDPKAAGLLAAETQDAFEYDPLPDPIPRLHDATPPHIRAALNQVLLAAITMLFMANRIDPFEGLYLDEQRPADDVLDWDAHDAAYWIAQAYATSNTEVIPLDTSYLTFWQWWLQDAIPAAWEAAQ